MATMNRSGIIRMYSNSIAYMNGMIGNKLNFMTNSQFIMACNCEIVLDLYYKLIL